MASEDKVHEVETMLVPLFRRDLSPSNKDDTSSVWL